MKELEYPFDNGFIMKKKRSLKRQLLGDGAVRLKKRVAVLGGSTTDDIVSVLELFLLDMGFECEFYRSEYGQFWQDAVFSNEELDRFKPDIVYIHTSLRNLSFSPTPRSGEEEIEQGLNAELDRLSQAWDGVKEHFGCPVIQNNFELPFFRLMGNMDASDRRGKVNFVTRLNSALYDRIAQRPEVYLNDINWLSAAYGLEKWSEPKYWYLYKYALNIEAIPELAFQVANIIKAIFGKNKKALALDLDNTLWGGIVGDDGVENLEIGKETAEAMAYFEFQQYVKAHKDLGVLLTVCSKNEEENALAGLSHPEGVLRPDDFVAIKANWLPKDKNIVDTAEELNILSEAFVFVDDNPAEREIVRGQHGCLCQDPGNSEGKAGRPWRHAGSYGHRRSAGVCGTGYPCRRIRGKRRKRVYRRSAAGAGHQHPGYVRGNAGDPSRHCGPGGVGSRPPPLHRPYRADPAHVFRHQDQRPKAL